MADPANKIYNIIMGWPYSHETNECCYAIEHCSGPHVVAATTYNVWGKCLGLEKIFLDIQSQKPRAAERGG